jgi:DNA-binding PadR family transcriptional regulator
VLALLAEEPMHGYQVMQELTDRSGGAWQPSPGSVYPTLQLLTDEGLLTVSDQNGRKIFELTGDGEAAAAAADGPPPWERLAAAGSVDLRHLMSTVASAAKQVAANGTEEQVEQAAELLTETRKRLYRLLAE